MEKLTFYSGTKNASSWAMRAWLALRQAGLPFDEIVIDIRRPQRFPNLEVVGRFSPTAMVPALVISKDVIFDSLAIMEFANDASGGALLPATEVDRAKARSILAWQHSGLSGICARISFESAFYPFKRPLTPTESLECQRLFDWLERLLAGGAGPFLFGQVSIADFALAPTAIRLTRHGIDLEAWPLSAGWAAALIAHPLVAEWLEEADRLPHVWLEDYLLPEQPPELAPAAGFSERTG